MSVNKENPHKQSAQKDRYLVVGNPVEHSLSPDIHRAFAAQCGDEITYDKALVPLGGFAEFVDEFARSGGCGLNVTVPFKADAFNYVDELDELAAAAGSVNTIRLAPDQPSRGFNTDGIGLVRDLQQRHNFDVSGKVVVILGAGGAARGVVAPLLQAGPRCLIVANRSVYKAQEIAADHTSRAQAVVLAASGLHDDLQQILERYGVRADLVINATSSGLTGGAQLLAAEAISGAFCYDMSYGAAAHFCVWAQDNGARISVDGLGMLVEQAAQSYFLWRGTLPRTDPVMAELRRRLEK